MIDWNRIDELRQDFGEDDFAEIAEVFLLEVQEKLDALDGQPADQLSDDFHFLKGSAANLGFRKLQTVCSDAEAKPEAARIPEVRALFRTSVAEFLTRYDTVSINLDGA